MQAHTELMAIREREVSLEETKTKLSFLSGLIQNPVNLLVAVRTGLDRVMGSVLGIDLDLPDFPSLYPEDVGIPTASMMTYASPLDRRLMIADASLRTGMSEQGVLQSIQQGSPGMAGVGTAWQGEGR